MSSAAAVQRETRALHPVEAHVLDAWGAVNDEHYVVTLTVHGNPVSQKNSKEIVRSRSTGEQLLVSSAKVRAWFGTDKKPGAVWQLKMLWGGGTPPIPRKAHVRAIVTAYLGARQHPDVDNLAAAPLDAMKAAGVLEDDKCIDTLLVVRRRAESETTTRVEIELVTDRLGEEITF